MTVDYRSLYVRAQRGVPNHLIPTHTLGPPGIASTRHTIVLYISGHQAAVTSPEHIAHDTKMLAKAPERL